MRLLPGGRYPPPDRWSHIQNFEVSEWDTLTRYLDSITSIPRGLTISYEWVVKSTSDNDNDDGASVEEGGEETCANTDSPSYRYR